MSVQLSCPLASSCPDLVILEPSVPPSDLQPELPKALLVDPVTEGPTLFFF